VVLRGNLAGGVHRHEAAVAENEAAFENPGIDLTNAGLPG